MYIYFSKFKYTYSFRLDLNFHLINYSNLTFLQLSNNPIRVSVVALASFPVSDTVKQDWDIAFPVGNWMTFVRKRQNQRTFQHNIPFQYSKI